MSTIDLPNDIVNSSVGSAEYINGEKLEENFSKIEDEWTSGTNTDFSVSSGDISSLNTSLSTANVIGNAGTTTINASVANVTTLNATNGTGLSPLGGVIAYAGTTGAPSGYHECNGQALSRGTYAELFALIGTTYGDGNGDGLTFSLPDYRGYFLRGYDHGAGNDPDAGDRTESSSGASTGDNIGTKQDFAIKDHFHKHRHYIQDQNSGLVNEGSYTHTQNLTNWSTASNTTSYDRDVDGNTEVGVNTTDGSSIVAAKPSTESRPKNISVMYIIRTS